MNTRKAIKAIKKVAKFVDESMVQSVMIDIWGDNHEIRVQIDDSEAMLNLNQFVREFNAEYESYIENKDDELAICTFYYKNINYIIYQKRTKENGWYALDDALEKLEREKNGTVQNS